MNRLDIGLTLMHALAVVATVPRVETVLVLALAITGGYLLRRAGITARVYWESLRFSAD